MKKRLFKIVLMSLIVICFIFILFDLNKEEKYKISYKFSDDVLIESNKIIKPTFKRANLGLNQATIINNLGDEIKFIDLEVGDKLRVDFRPGVLLSDPPGVSAYKVEKMN